MRDALRGSSEDKGETRFSVKDARGSAGPEAFLFTETVRKRAEQQNELQLNIFLISVQAWQSPRKLLSPAPETNCSVRRRSPELGSHFTSRKFTF